MLFCDLQTGLGSQAIPRDADTPPLGDLIRRRRRQLNLTLETVCRAADISKGYLSQVERGFAVPTITTLSRIAAALDTSLDAFIARPDPTDCITRADQRQRLALGPSELLYERLGAEFAGHALSTFIMTIPPGYRSEDVNHEGEETFYVLSGTLCLMLDGDDIALGPGDSAHYSARRLHGWANAGQDIAKVLWTGTMDLFREPIASSKSVDD